jgi:hypothetical protein
MTVVLGMTSNNHAYICSPMLAMEVGPWFLKTLVVGVASNLHAIGCHQQEACGGLGEEDLMVNFQDSVSFSSSATHQ